MQQTRMAKFGAHWAWLKVIWPFLAAMVLLSALAAFSLDVVSSVRACVAAEGMWSKAQQDAAAHLLRFATSHEDSDYRQFEREIEVSRGDRQARLALLQDPPDLAAARAGLLAGRVHPDDVDGMIRLFLAFRNFTFMQEVIALWEEGDRHIAAMADEAAHLRAMIDFGAAEQETLRAAQEAIRRIDASVRPLEQEFSETLGKVSRKVPAMLLSGMLAIAASMLASGIWIARAVLLRSRRFEQALQLSEERLQLAMQGSNDGFWDWNIAEDRVYYSPRCGELIGYPAHETVQESARLFDHVHPQDAEKMRAHLRAHLRDNAAFDIEFRVVNRWDEVRWVSARAQSVRDAGGRALRMAGCFTDITDRKRVEDQLYAANERAHVTLEAIGDAVVTVGTDGRIEYLNPAAELLTGRGLREARGAPLEHICCLIGGTSHERETGLVRRILAEDASGMHTDYLLLRGDGSEVAVDLAIDPIRDRESRIIGIVLVLHDVSKERAHASQLAWQAAHDELTGLANRREFERRLAAAMLSARDTQRQHTMLYIDLDRFKIVNDTCGHVVGDDLLRQISVLLHDRLREGDTFARLGGDEFGVLLENCSPANAVHVAEMLRQAVAGFRFRWGEQVFSIGCSIGLLNLGGDALTLPQAMSAADAACYMAKEAGRNRIHEYRPDDSELSRRQGETQWVARINDALANDRFCLYSQEIRDLGRQDGPHGQAVHAEILLRMLDEQGALIAPQAFIPAAERYNLMPLIDRWVVREVFAYLSQQRAGDGMATCAINLSGATIGDSRFLDFVREQQAVFGIDRPSVCFEITETAAIANLGKASAFIQELRQMGYRFALDDFGAGMSSFAYLKHLQVDYIKIDGGFVEDMLDNPTDMAMVEAINKIGHLMGKQVIAEFVNGEQMVAKLREMGVDFAQGYGIGEPQPLDFIAERTRSA